MPGVDRQAVGSGLRRTASSPLRHSQAGNNGWPATSRVESSDRRGGPFERAGDLAEAVERVV
ncbi:MAG TPA: hypothetical protein VNF04_00405 [Stellaceae bacterium]|nr:hypothetical protein [Stellaceae bacterium]